MTQTDPRVGDIFLISYLLTDISSYVLQCDLNPPLFSLLENSDITVICGTEHMDLSIYICPVYQALYNESLMVLNNELNNPECFGTADWSVDPPILKFKIPISQTAISACNSDFKVFFIIALPIIFKCQLSNLVSNTWQ